MVRRVDVVWPGDADGNGLLRTGDLQDAARAVGLGARARHRRRTGARLHVHDALPRAGQRPDRQGAPRTGRAEPHALLASRSATTSRRRRGSGSRDRSTGSSTRRTRRRCTRAVGVADRAPRVPARSGRALTDPAGFFTVTRAQRAHREFTADPVPDDDLRRILEAATWAPSAENSQPWEFIVVRDPDRRAELDELGRRLWRHGGHDASAGRARSHAPHRGRPGDRGRLRRRTRRRGGGRRHEPLPAGGPRLVGLPRRAEPAPRRRSPRLRLRPDHAHHLRRGRCAGGSSSSPRGSTRWRSSRSACPPAPSARRAGRRSRPVPTSTATARTSCPARGRRPAVRSRGGTSARRGRGSRPRAAPRTAGRGTARPRSTRRR